MTLSRLDGFFHETSPDAVRGALASLLDDDASPRDRSHGAVRSGESVYYAGGRRHVVTAGLACNDIFGSPASGERRFGHLALAGPVTHPTLPSDDALVRFVPVLPPADRPEGLVDAPTALTPQPHAITKAYASLLATNDRLARMHALAAPDVIVEEVARALQWAFDHLLRVVAGRDVPTEGWANDNPPRGLNLDPIELHADAETSASS